MLWSSQHMLLLLLLLLDNFCEVSINQYSEKIEKLIIRKMFISRKGFRSRLYGNLGNFTISHPILIKFGTYIEIGIISIIFIKIRVLRKDFMIGLRKPGQFGNFSFHFDQNCYVYWELYEQFSWNSQKWITITENSEANSMNLNNFVISDPILIEIYYEC